MLWVPKKGRLRVEHNTGIVGSASIGPAVTTGASAGTKGAVTELFASTLFDAYWMQIIAGNYGAGVTASEGMVDILIGAATEEVLIPNLLMGYCASGVGKVWSFPLYIPAGSRLAAASAGARVSTAVFIGIYLFGGDGIPPFRIGSKVVTYPTAPSVPRGLAITPGASGAEGAWTQVVAATSEDHFALVPSFQVETDTTTQVRRYAFDIGIGAAAAEEEIAQSYWFDQDSSEEMKGMYPNMPTFCDVPSGTRLAARVSNSGSNDAAYGCMIHAVS